MRNKGVVNQEQVLAWDAENRLAAVTYTNRTATGSGGGSLPTTCNGVPCKRVFLPLVMQQTPAERYSYDVDGARVRKETQTEVTRTIGPHFEVTVAITNGQVLTTTKYYDFGGQRIAVRQNGTLSYLHGDHLGSTSVTTGNSGATTNSVRYYAYGGQRTGNLLALPTDHTFTGQKLDKGTGLLYYGARYYDSALGMFVSPDSIVPEPGNPQNLNRYAYVLNQPLRLVDPTGHVQICADGDLGGGCGYEKNVYTHWLVGNSLLGMDELTDATASGQNLTAEAIMEIQQATVDAMTASGRTAKMTVKQAVAYEMARSLPAKGAASVGVCGSLGVAGFGTYCPVVIGADASGNIRRGKTAGGGGVMSFTASAVVNVTWFPDAIDISQLGGMSGNFGVGVGAVIVGGGDWVFSRQPDGEYLHGVSVNAGFGVKDALAVLPGEIHVGMTQTTFQSEHWNIYEWYRRVFDGW